MSTLPPDSHTARRLEHSTPEHLHATALRTFIGPIPEGWLKSHRKQWYKHYVTKGGNRAPTFTAAAQPSRIPEASAPVISSETPRPSSQSADVHGADTSASTTSLLRGQRDDRSSSRVVFQDAPTSQSQADGGPPEQRPSDLLRPKKVVSQVVATAPKVRFSDSTKQQIRQRARRLAVRGNLSWRKVKEGEVLKVDRMLVRSDITQQSVGTEFDEKVSSGVVTRPLDKWREYMVVCRRRHDDDTGAESVLQLYRTRVIAASAAEVGKSKKKPKVQIPLSLRKVHVNLFSSLDKTLCIWTTAKGYTTIYYLRPQSGAAAVDWYTFLRGVLGFKAARTLQVNVPDLSVTLRLDDPFRIAETTKTLADAAEGNDAAIAQAMNDEKGAAGAIVSRCISMLEQTPEWKDILKAWSQHDRIGLAWKRYDRLEWVYGAVEQRMYGTLAMAKTHDLELRMKNHYPLKTKTQDGETLVEPPPVEGFLIRLTSQKGHIRRMGRMLFKRLYFATHDQYLFFMRPANATPPPPPRLKATLNGSVPSSKDLAEQMPLTYDVDPYPLDDGHITWLDSGEGVSSASEQRRRDEEAAAGTERNSKMLMGCDGFINLCDVKKVRKMHRGAVPADENLREGSEVEFDTADEDEVGNNTSKQDDGATSEVDDARTFELLMTNGLVIRLQAYNLQTKNTWMKRLRELVTYWQLRKKQDMDLFKSVRQQNLEALQIDERAEAMVGSFAQRWEISGHSVASAEMYNLCGIAQCRTIHLAGLLFRKPRKHTTFTRCHVVLADGRLLVFQDMLRSRSGRKLVNVHHERIGSVDLRGCYVYSGLLTENDLLYQNRTFDSNTPGTHALPRVYLEDGWTSTDEDAMTTFVIWHATSRSWFRSSQRVDDVRRDFEAASERDKAAEQGGMLGKGYKTKNKLTRVSQLGTTGRSVVFKARSRAERDHWVMALQVEIERLAAEDGEGRGEGVRLVGEEV
ncbi:hypothetical protein LTR12_002046 [Friedmanniomyces endolithicus]|nr:hypothetical protein LTR12_002046 [Friedmanniomyces endolithicus]